MLKRLEPASLERQGEILGSGLDCLRHSHDEPPVAIQYLARVN